MRQSLETVGWDGAWYRRASYDDGSWLGSKDSEECRIDSVAQSWAAISGLADGQRAQAALDAALAELVSAIDPEGVAGIARLFTPAFANTAREPGYIKAYPPGVRENGGQYTHAAAWLIYALGRSGRGDDALRLFGLINPISHSRDAESAERYRVEPYVVAADIYGEGNLTGRGGWTWYTGSAGWLYRAVVEGILGITLRNGELVVEPALPANWPGFTATVHTPEGQRRRVTVSAGPDGPKVEIVDEVATVNALRMP